MSADLPAPTGSEPPGGAPTAAAPRPRATGGAAWRATGLPQAAGLIGLAARLGWLRLRGGPERPAAEAHTIADTLGRLKGPFAKVGQLLSLRVDLASPELREALAGLRDNVPPLPLETVRGVVEAELGAPLETLFSRFDAMPLGAASIAQVHRAVTRDGADVVVKVQYPWLRHSLPADLWVLRMALFLSGTLRQRGSLFDEFRDNINEELDFEREARVAGEIAANLGDEAGIVVPRTVPGLSTPRVLTMAWHPAFPIHDGAALDARQVPREELVTTLVRAYARQIFVDGLFHADPHPGNLFVVDEPAASTAPRILFIDFGLSKRLSPTLRRELRLGIYALLQGRTDDFIAGMHRLEMIRPGAEPGVRAALGKIFGQLEAEAGGSALGLSGDRVLGLKDRAKELLFETPGLTLPVELLLYARTLSYLFALANEVAPEIDVMKLTVPYLLRFLAGRDD